MSVHEASKGVSVKVEAKNLDHYGIVAGICDQIDLVGRVDRLVKSDPQRKVSVSECVKALIINGMGYTTRPLYLAHQFFESKPINLLIREDLSQKDLNDDTLGRVLDQLYANNCTKTFSHIAFSAASLAGINTKFRHLDTTNMQVYGEYEDECKATQYISFGYASKKGLVSHFPYGKR